MKRPRKKPIRKTIVADKKLFFAMLDAACQPVKPPCSHCDHDTGCGGGNLNSDGSGESWGTLVCCHCGRRESYRHVTGPRKLVAHGPYHPYAMAAAAPPEREPR